MRYFIRPLFLAGNLLLGLGATVLPAQGRPPTLPVIFQENFDPPGDDAPDRTVGAGSRSDGACPADEGRLRSRMPRRNFGLTAQSHPGIYIQLPATAAQRVLLAFRNEAGTYYERAFLPLPSPVLNEAQLFRFALPPTAAPLTVGENYQWTLVLVCGETVQPDDPVLTGWVQRTTTNARSADAQWFAQHGYWYDLLDAVYAVDNPAVAMQIGPLEP